MILGIKESIRFMLWFIVTNKGSFYNIFLFCFDYLFCFVNAQIFF